MTDLEMEVALLMIESGDDVLLFDTCIRAWFYRSGVLTTAVFEASEGCYKHFAWFDLGKNYPRQYESYGK